MSDVRSVVFVSGLSGAGLSSALKILEDIGYEVFDNFPLSLVDHYLGQESKDTLLNPIAFGIDTRRPQFSAYSLLDQIKDLKIKYKTYSFKLLCLVADDDVLTRRFSETRRRHPLARDKNIESGIIKDRELIQPIINKADIVLDTSQLTIHNLKRDIRNYFDSRQNNLHISLISFGFKYGAPRYADIILDVRFLQNPHWDKHLRALTGQNTKVKNYIQKDSNFLPYLKSVQSLLSISLPAYKTEGKSYLTLAIGCSGGRHRSVFMVETLIDWLHKNDYTYLEKQHLHLNR